MVGSLNFSFHWYPTMLTFTTRSRIRLQSHPLDSPAYAMPTTRKAWQLLGLASFFVTLAYLRYVGNSASWGDMPQVIGLGDLVPDAKASRPSSGESRQPGGAGQSTWDPKIAFVSGTTKPPGSNYTRTLVMPRLSDEKVDWVYEMLPADLGKVIYVADEPNAPLHPPKNKGREVMVYLTYVIDYYDILPDVSIFMHSHRWTWHNNDLHANDAVMMIEMLSSERVQREGYMNMRCEWYPGCPDWIHPGTMVADNDKLEETFMAKCWSEIFPNDPIPPVLAASCCAQFALSRDRIQSIPLSRLIFYRDWLLRTELSDSIAGRIWEYLWHVIFTGQSTYCPSQHACYCDGYGICFDSEDEFEYWFERRYNRNLLWAELADWRDKAQAIEHAKERGRLDKAAQLEVPELGGDERLQAEIDVITEELIERRLVAIERGKDPKQRAKVAGREWHKGDGY
jgi:hypothetical protein